MKSKIALYRIMTALQNNDEYNYIHLQQEYQTILKDLELLEGINEIVEDKIKEFIKSTKEWGQYE